MIIDGKAIAAAIAAVMQNPPGADQRVGTEG